MACAAYNPLQHHEICITFCEVTHHIAAIPRQILHAIPMCCEHPFMVLWSPALLLSFPSSLFPFVVHWEYFVWICFFSFLSIYVSFMFFDRRSPIPSPWPEVWAAFSGEPCRLIATTGMWTVVARMNDAFSQKRLRGSRCVAGQGRTVATTCRTTV